MIRGSLNKLNISYELKHLPDAGCEYKVWQLFFLDPNGACIEINFSTNEEIFDPRLEQKPQIVLNALIVMGRFFAL